MPKSPTSSSRRKDLSLSTLSRLDQQRKVRKVRYFLLIVSLGGLVTLWLKTSYSEMRSMLVTDGTRYLEILLKKMTTNNTSTIDSSPTATGAAPASSRTSSERSISENATSSVIPEQLSAIPEQLFEEHLYVRKTPIERLFWGPGLDAITAPPSHNSLQQGPNVAVCDFTRQTYSLHFPHSFQQLLRCFSWWQIPENQHKQPVLYVEDMPRPKMNYLISFFNVLRQQLNVTVDETHQYKNYSVRTHAHCSSCRQFVVDEDIGPSKSHQEPYAMRNPQDAEILREATWRYVNLTEPLVKAGCSSGAASSTSRNNHRPATSPNPVIGFLNREATSGRHVTNHHDIMDSIRQHKFDGLDPGAPQLQINYLSSFDGKSFEEQVAFMAQTDILIGPHGAQLTSVAFQPTCGGLVELFPKGYYMPSFFGTLARSTGHYHYSIYAGQNLAEEGAFYMSRQRYRGQARSLNITADPHAVLQSVQGLITRWQNCCQRTPHHFAD